MAVLSYHAQYERANRFALLEERLGFTKIVMEYEKPEEDIRECLTSSGILIIKRASEDFIITAWMASINDCYALSKLVGKSQVPPKLYKRVKKNQERHPELIKFV